MNHLISSRLSSHISADKTHKKWHQRIYSYAGERLVEGDTSYYIGRGHCVIFQYMCYASTRAIRQYWLFRFLTRVRIREICNDMITSAQIAELTNQITYKHMFRHHVEEAELHFAEPLARRRLLLPSCRSLLAGHRKHQRDTTKTLPLLPYNKTQFTLTR